MTASVAEAAVLMSDTAQLSSAWHRASNERQFLDTSALHTGICWLYSTISCVQLDVAQYGKIMSVVPSASIRAINSSCENEVLIVRTKVSE